MWACVPTSGSDSSSTGNQEPVYLNVYDLTPVNAYVYWIGLGIFHSGIEAHGVEYAFGAHDQPSSGVFEVEPQSCPGFTYRNRVLLGFTSLTPQEFRSFIERCADDYYGDSYNLIGKNCNHFSNDVCNRLTGKDIPGWVNRLARIGGFCNCLLPESLQATAIKHSPEYQTGFEVETNGLNPPSRKEVDKHSGQDRQLLIAPNGDMQTLMREFMKDATYKHCIEDLVKTNVERDSG